MNTGPVKVLGCVGILAVILASSCETCLSPVDFGDLLLVQLPDVLPGQPLSKDIMTAGSRTAPKPPPAAANAAEQQVPIICYLCDCCLLECSVINVAVALF